MALSTPENMSFNDLNLHYVSDGQLSLNSNVLRQFLAHNCIDVDAIEDFPSFEGVGHYIVAWYLQHKFSGGQSNDSIEYMFDFVNTRAVTASSMTH